jgi:hypothetical protein
VAAPNNVNAAATSAPADQCNAKPRCYDAGPCVAEVTSVTASQAAPGASHVIRVGIRFRNTSAQPLVLAYKAHTGAITDNLGNPYVCCGLNQPDLSASGMPVVEGPVSPSFVLKPGQSSSASFTLTRFNPGRNAVLGTSFTYDLVVMELEVLNSAQVRDGREYSMHFPDLTIAGLAFPASTNELNDSVQKLKSIFGRKK